jgi:lipooligosaccharide transport system permease protein
VTPPLVRVVEREARVFSRLWRGSVFSSLLAPLLFLGSMGIGLGGLVDERNTDVAGVTYLQFVAPGLLVASAMQATAGGSLWPVLGGFKWLRTYHGVVATPVPPGSLYGGLIAWLSIRTGISAVAFLVVAGLLGAIPSWWGVVGLPIAMLCAAAFAAPLAAYTATQDTDVTFPLVFRMIVMPLFLFSGTFFPTSQLPDGLEPLIALSPLYHASELARAATTGRWEWASLAHAVVLVGCVAAGAWWGRRTFTRRLST